MDKKSAETGVFEKVVVSLFALAKIRRIARSTCVPAQCTYNSVARVTFLHTKIVQSQS